MEEKKDFLINKKIKFLILLLSFNCSLELLIDWILWKFKYNDIINNVLSFFSNSFFVKNYRLTLNFNNLTIFTISFAVSFLLLFFTLFLCKNKKIPAKIFSFLTFLISLVFILCCLLFVVKTYSMYNDFYHQLGLKAVLVWFLAIGIGALFILMNLCVSVIYFILTFIKSKDFYNNDNKEIESQIVDEQNITVTENKTETERSVKKEDYSFLESQLTPFDINYKVEKITKKRLNNSKNDNKGQNYTKEEIDIIWEKATIISGVNPDAYRKDYAGAWMFKNSFTMNLNKENNTKSYAWTIVKFKINSDTIDNLVAMNIFNAQVKKDNYSKWKSIISSNGNENIVIEKEWDNKL